MSDYFYIQLTKCNQKTELYEHIDTIMATSLEELNEIKNNLQIKEDIKEDNFVEVLYLNVDYEWFDIQGTTYTLVKNTLGIEIK